MHKNSECRPRKAQLQHANRRRQEVAMDETILREILRNCSENSDRPVYHWINETCDVVRVVTYGELRERSREIAVELLLSLYIVRGERVLLCYPPGLDFIISFIACLRAGITAGMNTH